MLNPKTRREVDNLFAHGTRLITCAVCLIMAVAKTNQHDLFLAVVFSAAFVTQGWLWMRDRTPEQP